MDYFLLAPLFNPPPIAAEPPKNLLLIGLAAGTISELYTKIYGPLPLEMNWTHKLLKWDAAILT